MAHVPIQEDSLPLPHLSSHAAIAAVVDLVENSSQSWRTSDLVRALPHLEVLEVVMAIANLHRSGGLERCGVATYRAATGGAAETAARNEEMMWGDAS